MHPHAHRLHTYVDVNQTRDMIQVFNENDGQAPRNLWGPDGRLWYRRMTSYAVPEGYEPKPGDYILVPLAHDDIPELAVIIGEQQFAELEKAGYDEDDEIYGLSSTILQVAIGLAREIEIYHAGRLTTKEPISEEGPDRDLRVAGVPGDGDGPGVEVALPAQEQPDPGGAAGELHEAGPLHRHGEAGDEF